MPPETEHRRWLAGDIVYCKVPDGKPRIGVVIREPDNKEHIMSIQLYIERKPLAWRTSVYTSWCEYIGNINVC